MTHSGINKDIADSFNALPDQSETEIALTKSDIALLVSSLSELHKSYAASQELPYLLGREADLSKLAEMERSAKASYDLFAQFANGLMARFVDEAAK